jgi:Na+-driven multidrug efflux pump
MIFIVNIGLKEGLIIKLSHYIRKRRIKYTQNIGIKSLKIFFGVSIIFVFLMLMYVDEICNFFFTASAAKEIFKEKYWILFFSIIVDSLNLGLGTMMKVFNKDYSLLSTS